MNIKAFSSSESTELREHDGVTVLATIADRPDAAQIALDLKVRYNAHDALVDALRDIARGALKPADIARGALHRVGYKA